MGRRRRDLVLLIFASRPLRAVYVAANSSATMRSIGIGVYNLHVELGRDVDAERLRFQNDRSAPETFGPFEFLEITSENGVSGKRYEVALNPGSR